VPLLWYADTLDLDFPWPSPSYCGLLIPVLQEIEPAALSEDDVLRLARQLLVFCDALHRQASAAHMDLSASNLMTDADGNLQVIDFGLALQLLPNTKIRSAGTPRFRAPEVADETVDLYGAPAADVFSAGCCILHLASASMPPGLVCRVLDSVESWAMSWPDILRSELASLQGEQSTSPAISVRMHGLLDLVSLMMAVQEPDRPSAAEALGHQVFIGPAKVLSPPLKEKAAAQEGHSALASSPPSTPAATPAATKPLSQPPADKQLRVRRPLATLN